MERRDKNKFPLLTFLSERGLQKFLEQEVFLQNNKEFLSSISKIIAVYTPDNNRCASELDKAAERIGIPVEKITVSDAKDFRKIYDEVIERKPELLTEQHYIDHNHGTTEMRMVGFYLSFKNKKNSLVQKTDEKRGKSGDWSYETTKLELYSDFYILYKEQELEVAKRFLTEYDFNAALETLSRLYNFLKDNPNAKTKEIRHVEYLKEIASCFMFWERFNHLWNTPEAPLGRIKHAIDIAGQSDDSRGRMERRRRLEIIKGFFEKCNPPTIKQGEAEIEKDEILADRFHNAQLKMQHCLYDDAVARFYSLAEAIVKVELAKEGINNSRIKLTEGHKKKLSETKEGAKILNALGNSTSEEIKFPLLQSYKLLGCLNEKNEIAKAFFRMASKEGETDPFDPNKDFNPKKYVLLDNRNSSILAHGSKPVKKEDAKKWEELCKELLSRMGIDEGNEEKYPSIMGACRRPSEGEYSVLFSAFE